MEYPKEPKAPCWYKHVWVTEDNFLFSPWFYFYLYLYFFYFYFYFIKTKRSKGLKGPRKLRFLPKFRPITQSTHRTGNGPPKSGFFLDFLGHLKAKWAEIWSENRFLKMIRGDFDFGHFRPFLAELRHFFLKIANSFFWKILIFSKNEFFSKKLVFLIFLFSQPLGLWVSMRSPCQCDRVGTQYGGIQIVFRCLLTHFKKTGI